MKSTCILNPNFHTEVDPDLSSVDSQLGFLSLWSTVSSQDSIIHPHGLVVVMSVLHSEVCLKDIFNTCTEYFVAYHSEVAMETCPSGHNRGHRPSFSCGHSKYSFRFNLNCTSTLSLLMGFRHHAVSRLFNIHQLELASCRMVVSWHAQASVCPLVQY